VEILDRIKTLGLRDHHAIDEQGRRQQRSVEIERVLRRELEIAGRVRRREALGQ